MKNFLLAILCLFFMLTVTSQVAINTDASTAHGSAMLDIKSNNKGFLPPRMTWTQIQAIPNPAKGLVVFDDGLSALRLYDGSKWVVIGPRIYDITDPPGDFNMEAITGTGTATGLETVISPNKTIYVGGYYIGVVTIGNTTLPAALGSHDLFVAAYDSLANLLWVKTINGSGGEFLQELRLDQSGNILVCGNFSETMDLDPGPGADNHSAAGTSQDAFFAKYDNNLNLIWGKHFGSTGDDRAISIVTDLTGNVFVTGNFSLMVDFDPGAGIANLNSAGNTDVFIARYDINGNWIWSNRLGNASFDNSMDIELLSGTIVIGGHFNGTVDFDPSAGTANLISAGLTDIFHARYDIAGGYLWAKRIGGTLNESLTDLTVDASGNFWSLGKFEGTCDMDPDAGVVNLVASANDNTYFAKYQSSGAYSLAKGIGSTGAAESASEILLDAVGNVYICGSFAGTGTQVEFDPNATIVNRSSLGSYDPFIAKYDPAGNFMWVADMGGIDYDLCYAFSITSDGKLIFATGANWSSTYFGFNGERIKNNNQFFLARYEE